MIRKRICIAVLLTAMLTSCSGGGIKTETMTPEERAESHRLMEESRAAAESESLRLEQEAKKAEAEAKKKAEEEARALKEAQLAEDKVMAAQDFEENRYTTFQGVDYELTFMDSFNGHYLDTDKWA